MLVAVAIGFRLRVELHSKPAAVTLKTAEVLYTPRPQSKDSSIIPTNAFIALVADGLLNPDGALTVDFHCLLSGHTVSYISF